MEAARGADATGQSGEATPPITTGSFVSWDGGTGRVNMIVTSGKVPGVDGDVTGTRSAPAARVVVWERDGGAWAPTRQQAGVMVSQLDPIPPLKAAAAPSAKSADGALVAVHTQHKQAAAETGAPAYTIPAPEAIKAVYERGMAAWPGQDKTALTAQEWALGRVAAFLELAAGVPMPRYVRDVDLLPPTHPLRASPQ